MEQGAKMRKAVCYFIVIILGLAILNVIAEIDKNINSEIMPTVDAEMLRGYFYNPLLCILFGLLIEWKRVLTILSGNIKVNRLIIPSIALLLVSLIPFTSTIYWVGIASYHNFPLGIVFAPLQSTHTMVVLGVLNGILLSRSFVQDK